MPTLPDAQEASRQAVERLQDEAEINIEQAVRGASDQAVRLYRPDRANAAPAAQLVGDALASAVLLARTSTKTESLRLFDQELRAVGAADAVIPEGDAEDIERATAVGNSFAAAWMVAFDAAYQGNGPAAARSAIDDVVSRVHLIAVTEVVHAFSSARDQAMQQYARDAQRRDQPVPTKRWNCQGGNGLATHACSICFSLCGVELPFSTPFQLGLPPFRETVVPGSTHPNCACWLTVSGPGVVAPAATTDWPADLNARRR